MKTILVTVADDRAGRKGGQYSATQARIREVLGDWIEQKHYTIDDFGECDPLMVHTDAGKNGRVYKPWSILDALLELEDGDFLIYNDCSPELWKKAPDLANYDLSVIQKLTRQAGDFLVPFVKWDRQRLGPDDLGIHTHRYFTLDSCLAMMEADACRDSYLCASGMICIRKTEYTVSLVEKWLAYNRVPECACYNIDETENSYWDGQRGQKLGNRHDQSVLSVVLNQEDFSFVDIVHSELNPHNFLNFCLPNYPYRFINSNGSRHHSPNTLKEQ